ncbi:MAG: cysteine desulfurase family protein [Bacteroidota bacterium]
MKPKLIYLDNNATTPVDPRVLEEMLPFFTEKFGNASSIHHPFGWDAEEAVTHAREQAAELIGAKPNAIYFTSGATEAINLALKGVYEANKTEKNHIITCQTEHRAVLDTCAYLENQGCRVTYLSVDEAGVIDFQELANSITAQTLLVSIMHANNETGVIQPLQKIADLVKEKAALFMTDATQSVGKVPFDVNELPIDLAVFSSHKMYGPKGAGALYVSKKSTIKIAPYLHGGGQEKDLRPGTLNVPGIVGFGKACELCLLERENESEQLTHLRDRLESSLLKLEGVVVNGHPTHRLPHVTNLSFGSVEGGSPFIRALKGLAVSQGSACSSNTMEPSHVLKSMGVSNKLALSTIRFGIGRFNTTEEIDEAIRIVARALEELRPVTIK